MSAPPAGRIRNPWSRLRLPPNVGGFDVTRDGQRFLAGVPEGKMVSQSITVVTNWQEELKRHAEEK
jgi:hypothetical protein